MSAPDGISPASSKSPKTGLVSVGAAILDEVRGWPNWWAAQSALRKVGPLLAVLLYWAILVSLKGFRTDHLTTGLVILAFGYLGRLAWTVFGFIFPVLLTAILYDSQRFYSDYIRGRIRVSEPYDFDKKFFGITTPNGVLTPNEFFQLHTHPFLDVITGAAYLIFVGVFVVTAGYFYFRSAKVGTGRHSAQWIRERVAAPGWSFFWVNMIGYSTYYWYPAAPPWYVSLYGLGPADLSAKPNAAGCVRFDQFLGTHFFDEWYGRSADVFGAIPSLHVAYPLLAVMFAFRFGTWRTFSVFFYLLMCFSAVYLNHHYVLDVLWGSVYALLTGWALMVYYDRRAARRIAG